MNVNPAAELVENTEQKLATKKGEFIPNYWMRWI
jgi:hypothetical protein